MSELQRNNLSEKDMNKIKKVEKAFLIRHLKRNKITISNEDLDEVINAYNHLIDFYFENDRRDTYYRFGFLGMPKFLYDQNDEIFLKIFHLVIDMQKNNLLNYLDYVLLTYSYTFGGTRLFELYKLLNNLMKMFHEKNNNYDFIYDFINENAYLLEDMLDNHLSEINDSNYISQEYKDIMNIYNDIIYDYYCDEYNEFDEDAYFVEFYNMSYYYFLINDLFKKEPNEVLNFMNKVSDNIPELCDKLNMDGEMEYKERIQYIDSLYKSKNKVKIIK